MKKISALLTILILVGIFVPAVSAESIITDEILSEYTDTSGQSKITGSGSELRTNAISKIKLLDVSKARNINYIGFDLVGDYSASYPEGRQDFTWYLGQDKSITGNGYFIITHSRNVLGNVIGTHVILYFYDFNIGGLTGTQIIEIDKPFCTIGYYWANPVLTNDGNSYALLDLWGYDSLTSKAAPRFPYYTTISSYDMWQNHIVLTDKSPDMGINIYRVIDSQAYQSSVSVVTSRGEVFNSEDTTDIELIYPVNTLKWVNITSPAGTLYPFNIDALSAPSVEEDNLVTVYVKNSQNGALIANSHIDISAFVNGEFHEVVNETLPGGIYTGNLQPTGGGLPNPDYYRLIATAEGYNSIMPYIDFEHDSDTTIYAILDPIGGAPEDENNTFIDFYVRDINANPIAGATVKFGGYTLYTNNAGYTIFEVKKDNTYTWSVSKLGYGSVTGNAVIGSNARYTVNAVLAPEVTPTTPTPKPSVTPVSPTPTLTAPNGEPVSNWLEWFAAHFGMILGGGVEIGKIFMWLCFTVPVGVYVGNKAKAGAVGFMAGAGIVTLFFVLIGWVHIWLVVLLALLIGLLYAKVYSNTDNGGGR